jgi:hypothetical protein
MSTHAEQQLAPEQLLEDLKKYLERFKSQPGPLGDLKQLLNSQPNIERIDPLMPDYDINARLDLAEQLQSFRRLGQPSWQFNAAQFAVFLLIPTPVLQSYLDYGKHKDLVCSLDTIVFAMRWCRSPRGSVSCRQCDKG